MLPTRWQPRWPQTLQHTSINLQPKPTHVFRFISYGCWRLYCIYKISSSTFILARPSSIAISGFSFTLELGKWLLKHCTYNTLCLVCAIFRQKVAFVPWIYGQLLFYEYIILPCTISEFKTVLFVFWLWCFHSIIIYCIHTYCGVIFLSTKNLISKACDQTACDQIGCLTYNIWTSQLIPRIIWPWLGFFVPMLILWFPFWMLVLPIILPIDCK